MTRTVTAATLAQLQAQKVEFVHLLDLVFSGGTLRFTTGSNDIVWNSNTYFASGSAMAFEGASESLDHSSQRLKMTLDGVSLGAIASLLAQNYIGRLSTLRRAYFNAGGQIIADPIILFVGYLNSPWEVTEDWDGRWAKVTTELVSPLAIFDQVRGITCDPGSHQLVYAGDTFFTHIASKPEGDFGWGSTTWQGKRDPWGNLP
jgi:hypothetical protein